MRIFVEVDGETVAAFAADHAPSIGHAVWVKTLDATGTFRVLDVEHQFDRSCSEYYSSHDVRLICRHEPATT